MAEILFAVTMHEELRPRLWKRVVLTLILAGMTYGLFEGLTSNSAIMVAVRLLAVIYIWIDYYLKKNIYRKYHEELIKMTAIK
jgi:hypothetical protein